MAVIITFLIMDQSFKRFKTFLGYKNTFRLQAIRLLKGVDFGKRRYFSLKLTKLWLWVGFLA